MSTYYHMVLSDSDINGKSVKHTIKFIKVVASSKMLSTIHQKEKNRPRCWNTEDGYKGQQTEKPTALQS